MFMLFQLLLGTALAKEVALTGSGEASYTKKKQMMNAREDAIEIAIQGAVEKGLEKFATPDQLKENADAIETEILLTAPALITRYEIVSEKDRDKTITIIIKAYMDDEMLQANLDSIGVSSDVSSRRTIAILIDEYVQGDVAPSNEPVVSEKLEISSVDASSSHSVSAKQKNDVASSSRSRSNDRAVVAYQGYGEAAYGASDSSSSSSNYHRDKSSASYDEESQKEYSAFNMSLTKYFPPEALKQPRADAVSSVSIASVLIERDVRLVDASTIEKVRSGLVEDGALSVGFLPPEELSQKAMEFGSEYGFDAIMIGTTIITRDDTSEAKGIDRANATLAVKIIDTATGDIVASQVTNQNGKGTTFSQAADSSADRLGNVLGQDLGDQLFKYWKNRDEKGMEITIIVQVNDPSTKLKIAVTDALQSVDGATNVTERKFDKTNGIIEYTITTKRPMTDVKNDCIRAFMKQSSLDGLEEEKSLGSLWTFSIP